MDKQQPLGIDDFVVLETLGSGAYGKVYKIKSKHDGNIYVWKEISFYKMSNKEKELIVSGKFI